MTDERTERLFGVPLYSVADAARHIDVSRSTFDTWVRGYERRRDTGVATLGAPVVTAVPAPRGQPCVPFIGLAEGFVLAGFRAAGVPLQRIRPAVGALRAELGLEHVLASESLYTDGAEVLYDFAERRGDSPEAEAARELVAPRSGQRVFTPVVQRYLQRITFEDGYARLVELPRYERARVVVDPDRSFGVPIFASGAARVGVVLGRFKRGEPLDELSEEFGVPADELLDAIRVHTDTAA
ncbi:hypothetical protein Ae168Ps1_2279c [Pseudonocardia sp. Ae168_Ps1]|uniref:DUF433 domain-containing protein n=1 Tax=unclassified Pseudonocardia TaxID=2619320 RepID=UPI00094B2561|nr:MULTISPECIES: hypothetical protein [unclassified Pseudonocardia]OLL73894.1 hypothetical protein Ae150APs1_2272c [Pseudonocardia sp. Ae150A_Ps1]OLL79873.1 hypothetical protein Ae168Ps1_2279c [Pseudonocardia sp. Ae168_Ps1]OLL85994.1 hypothetical protein Ae263Ps1_3049 [Pseudonocardia sp. Ae263_Ps1]OLL93975.1 hypothetical protein Ae356Ps1_3872c [Pseudonocardia sp. Ae356_Ps1]